MCLDKRLGKITGPQDSAVTNLRLLAVRPPAHNALPRQMDDGMESGNGIGRHCLRRIPANLPIARSGPAHKTGDAIPASLEGWQQGTANQAGCASNQDAGGIGSTHGVLNVAEDVAAAALFPVTVIAPRCCR